jgi:hypothetical protein
MKKEVIELTRYDLSFDALKWVAGVTSKDPTRAVLHNIHIESDPNNHLGVIAVATDGRQLRAAKIAGLYAPANYMVKTKNSARIILIAEDVASNYPAWEKVIPTCSPSDMKTIQLVPARTKCDLAIRNYKIAVDCYSLKNTLFNLDYLLGAFGGMDTASVYQADKEAPLLIRDNVIIWTRQAVLMPCVE